MSARTGLHAIAALLVGLVLWAAPGCSDSSTPATPDQGGPTDATTDGLPLPANYDPVRRCYSEPTTHVQIINSCPSAGVTLDRLEKSPALPLLNADGTRPPLP